MPGKKFHFVFSSVGTLFLSDFIKLTFRYKVDARYCGRWLVAGIFCLLSEPFRWYEKLIYDKRLSQVTLPSSPVFILGHWRSGTTLLHNAMCRDPQFAFVSTYQGVFVNLFFSGRWLFKPFMKWLIPEKRPADNVLLSPDFPQEEEVALCNNHSFAFYLFWYFPRHWKTFYTKYLSCESAVDEEVRQWQVQYKKLIAQGLLDQGKQQFVSKNPPNTARVTQLLRMFPDAKFIYLYRNPVVVYLSTLRFFSATLESLQLQKLQKEELEEMVFELYQNLISDYEKQKTNIPPGNLVEIRYEDFLDRPLNHLELIYEKLQLKGFDSVVAEFKAHLDSQKEFEKNRHAPDRETVINIKSRLAEAMKLYGYTSTGLEEERASGDR